ncbi:ATP-binding protein [Nocardioides taihuensis]|uniref:histidine kinase n=1 Tax=Nocardioides taihuensis TaxID=1835606 RepID=A0ABW0BS27_9ACTN
MPQSQPSSLQFFADAYPDGAVGADVTGKVTVLNATAARMLQVVVDDALGRPLADVLRLQDTNGRTWLEANRPFESINIRTGVPEQSWLLPDGSEVLVTARLVRGQPLGPLLGVGIGLRSGRGRARLDRERSDLVATVAHELRSPLTGVKGFVQAMLNRWDRLNDDQKKLMLTTVHADSERLSRLIAELLDVARLDTGRLSLYPRACDLTLLVTRVVESVRAGTARPIVLVATPDLPAVTVDPDKFTQVVTNLVENGVRHGEGTVTVTTEALADGTGVRVVVEDEGSGIAPEMRRRVFTKFWRSGVRGGSGLGLYLVNGLVKAHGGVVTIADSADGGARVETTWPTEGPRPLGP